MEAERRLDELQARLGLVFKRRELLREAMTHTSWINERGDQGRDNERLEYLGDAVLELVAGEYLFSRFPNYDEGQLTQMRSSLVSTVALAKIGEQLRLGETLRLGRGAAKSGARRLTSLHANAFEALVGAIFLDQGYRRVGKVFLTRIGDLSAWTDPNFKGRLQALAQERFGAPPQYKTVAAPGDPRSRQYLAQLSVEGHGLLGEGTGGTKQAAEQAAARAAIDLLVAPVSKKRRRRRPASAVAELATPTGGSPPPLAVVSPPGSGRTEEATVRSRRRRRTAPVSAVETLSESAVAADPVTPAAESLGSAPPLPTAPRRRRSRSRKSTSAQAPAHVPATADPEASFDLPAGGAVPRRRRRRSPTPPAGEAGGSDSVGAPLSPASPPGAEEGPKKRRRRRPQAASQRALAGPAHVPAAGIDSGAAVPAAGGPEGVETDARRRTHRGHRGGRKRSGRAVTPAP